jgi:hypothetical protein
MEIHNLRKDLAIDWNMEHATTSGESFEQVRVNLKALNFP